MSEQTNTNVTDWLEQEAQEVNKQSNFDGEKLPALKFVENKIIEFDVDFSVPFKEYDDKVNQVLKAIIPVTEKGVKKVLWLNKSNPLYKDLILGGKAKQTHFKVIQVGSKATTKYNLVQE